MITEEIKTLLRAIADGKPIQHNVCGKWTDTDPGSVLCGITRNKSLDFRIKPEPLECWVNVYDDGINCYHDTQEKALNGKTSMGLVRKAVHMREVIE